MILYFEQVSINIFKYRVTTAINGRVIFDHKLEMVHKFASLKLYDYFNNLNYVITLKFEISINAINAKFVKNKILSRNSKNHMYKVLIVNILSNALKTSIYYYKFKEIGNFSMRHSL